MAESPSPLLAGAARVDITPEPGIQLAGDIGRWRPVETIADRLYANALVLAQGEERLCLLSLDLLASTQPWIARIRAGIRAFWPAADGAIMVHVTQNHAAPTLGHFFMRDECPLMPAAYPWLRGGDDRYHQPTVDRCVEAVRQAVAKLAPVTLSGGRAIDGTLAFNRRYVLRDGTSRMQAPLGDPSILRSEGPADPEIGVLRVDDASGNAIACLLHFTSHPCHGYPRREVIGDWPGAWAGAMRERLGGQCVPLVINGCCGNVIHGNSLDPRWQSDYRTMGAKLAEAADRALAASVAQAPRLAWRRREIVLSLRPLPPETVDAARELIARHPEPVWLDDTRTRVAWEWVYAVCRLDLADIHRAGMSCPYEIQAFRLGDTALVTLMGEPFVEAQLAIKEAVPAPFTQVAHFCNGYAGYIPTREALRRGGFETNVGNWSKFAPEALETITEAAIGLARELW